MSSANYWLAKETAKIVINLEVSTSVHWCGFAAKQFRVKLRLWEGHNVWKSILNGTLDDPTGKVTNSIALGSPFEGVQKVKNFFSSNKSKF